MGDELFVKGFGRLQIMVNLSDVGSCGLRTELLRIQLQQFGCNYLLLKFWEINIEGAGMVLMDG